jgi:hypothetical protein
MLDVQERIFPQKETERMGHGGLRDTRPPRAFFDSVLSRSLVRVLVMMMVVVMVGMYYHHDLRLRRIRYCEAEEKQCSKQKLFHNL